MLAHRWTHRNCGRSPFSGWAYPFVLPFHAFFLIWWGLFRPKRMLVSALAIALGWGHVGEYFQLLGHSTAPTDAAGASFKVMSYNVRLFDLYNWNNNAQTRNEIFDVIAFENADILCTQEFFKADDGFFDTKDTLMRSFGYSGCHEEYTHHTKRGHHFGIATFSSYPIVGKGTIHFPDELNNLVHLDGPGRVGRGHGPGLQRPTWPAYPLRRSWTMPVHQGSGYRYGGSDSMSSAAHAHHGPTSKDGFITSIP
jgi:hypothetical protein